MEERTIPRAEQAAARLQGLYRQYGYLPYKMSKFEEYDLYVKNKEFLIGDGVITFTDTDGKLLALKPDVTLSIIQNSKDISGVTQKVYYNENVYRISGSTHTFKEIMQTGLECIGDIDIYSLSEVVMLAVRSLAVVSETYLLDLSHMGIVPGAKILGHRYGESGAGPCTEAHHQKIHRSGGSHRGQSRVI